MGRVSTCKKNCKTIDLCGAQVNNERKYLWTWCIDYTESDCHSLCPSDTISLMKSPQCFQVIAWWHPHATRHYLNQRWPRSMSPYGVTGPQWVKPVQLSYHHCQMPATASVAHCQPDPNPETPHSVTGQLRGTETRLQGASPSPLHQWCRLMTLTLGLHQEGFRHSSIRRQLKRK